MSNHPNIIFVALAAFIETWGELSILPSLPTRWFHSCGSSPYSKTQKSNMRKYLAKEFVMYAEKRECGCMLIHGRAFVSTGKEATGCVFFKYSSYAHVLTRLPISWKVAVWLLTL